MRNDIWKDEEKPQLIDEIAIGTINNLKKEFDLKIGVVTGNPSHKIISN